MRTAIGIRPKLGRTEQGRRKHSRSRDAIRAVRPIKDGKRSRAELLSLRNHPKPGSGRQSVTE